MTRPAKSSRKQYHVLNDGELWGVNLSPTGRGTFYIECCKCGLRHRVKLHLKVRQILWRWFRLN